jgi:dihydropteroate synthase
MPSNLENEKSQRQSSLKIGGKVFEWGTRTYIMGILNVTPDSFSGDGTMRNRADWVSASIDAALRMEDLGADIIDIGGESTRPASVYPDARPVTADEELQRVLPVISALRGRCDLPISIDTRKSKVADVALSEGASVANDVSMLSDPQMAKVAAKHDAPIVINHIRSRAEYEDVVSEIVAELSGAVSHAIHEGVDRSNIIIDPGIGFAKNAQHSLEVLRNLDTIKSELAGRPMLIGASRKSFIGAILDADPEARIEGNAASTALAIAQGVDIVRVHEVQKMARVAKVADAIVRGWETTSIAESGERVRRAIERET